MVRRVTDNILTVEYSLRNDDSKYILNHMAISTFARVVI